MTATVTPQRSGAVSDGNDSFGSLLHAEWTKFRTVRGWVIAMVVAAALTAAVGLYAASGPQTGCQPVGRRGPIGPPAPCKPSNPVGPDGEAVSDSYYFVHRALRGNGGITVRVTSLTGRTSPAGGGIAPGPNPEQNFTRGIQPWAKAGILVTASTRPGSAYAAVMVTGAHGVRMQYDYTGDTPGLPGAVSAASPRWLRLVRSGDTLTGYDSADGAHWTQVGTVSLAGLPATVQAGPFVTSPAWVRASNSGPTVATAVFDRLSVPAAPVIPVGASLLRGHGNYVFPMSALTEVRLVAGIAALLAVSAVLALAAGTILRHAAGAITAVVALTVVVYFFSVPLAVLPAGAADWLLRVTPAAGFAIQQYVPAYPQVNNAYTPQHGYYPLAPWAGFGVLCLWTALALCLAAALLRRRDA